MVVLYSELEEEWNFFVIVVSEVLVMIFRL